MKKSYTVFVLLLAVFFAPCSEIAAQGKKKKAVLKSAKEHIRFEEYQQAIPFIQELLVEEERNPYYNYWMGKSLYLTYKKNQALKYLDVVNEVNPDVDNDFHYFYGLTLHYNNFYDKAISEYKKDLLKFDIEDPRYRAVSNRISQATYAKRFEDRRDSKLVSVNNMGESINTEYSEHSPVISGDNSLLMYTARRPDSKGAQPEQFYYDEDIYMARKEGEGWSTGANIDEPINSKGHDATISLTADGKTLYIYRHKKAGGLYRTDFDDAGKKWKEPRPIEKPLNSKYYEASVCQSADSNLLFFSSNRPGGYGGLDIYVVKREGKDWGEPENMGPGINTPFNEDAPFIHPDGVTFYYSSDGSGSIGGYDIFVTEYDSSESKWLQPLNMGPPVNSADDEIYFVLSTDGLTGYFASGREGGLGEKDIYQVNFPYFRYPKRYYAMEIAGIVQDINSMDTLPSTIQLIDVETNEVVDEMSTNVSSGKYSFEIEPERSYSLSVSSEGYEPVVDEFIAPNKRNEDFLLVRNIMVEKPIGSIAAKPLPPVMPVVQHIYFDFDKQNLRKSAEQELGMIAQLLEQNEQMTVEVLGHTDYYGTFDYNVNLSKKRSSAAVQYLKSRGIDSERIQENWFSENKPVRENDNDDGRQYNRRCEFRLYQPNGELALSSVLIRPGNEGPIVDHTLPKGEAGYDHPDRNTPSEAVAGVSSSSDQNASPSHPSRDGSTFSTTINVSPSPDGANWNSSNNTATSSNPLPASLQGLDLRHIYFDFDRADLRNLSKDQLGKVARIMQRESDLVINIKGHTDNYGSTTYNQRLSERRAEEAYEFLLSRGVPAQQIVVNGFSELQPIDSNTKATGRQSNRRVEFEIRNGSSILLRSTP